MDPINLLNKDRIFNIIIHDSILYLYKIEKNLKKYNPTETSKFKQVIKDLMEISQKISKLDYTSKNNCEMDRYYSKLLLKENNIDLWK